LAIVLLFWPIIGKAIGHIGGFMQPAKRTS
jgi:hypothetical protein